MVKLTGNKKIKTSIFISGKGSNLKNLIKYSKKKNSKIKIVLVISNNRKAKGLNFAKNEKIKNFSMKYNKKNENKILLILKKNKINLICLAGFMKILSKNFIKKFDGKIINIHPSLLPKYKGLNTHERVLENNEKFTGATVHIVNTKLDSGKIIIQKKIKVYRNDDKKSLKKKVLKIEHLIYPKAIEILSTSF
jgi:phosphoribosylglycinamide formyltransferase-1|tara:strand:- start:435 stop:1013 length:579 start_codon:yes stop_codon:yes gene_type:complete